ncbi:uncharacterized protein LOC110021378 isoform X2 [Phalaenopsis equestris]|uniref:uncharacterized protein LOC110021378 isoform X2 n=1 Tax=Phalaenopsis equestris TaxID=78828 RepID=UPI0009E56709|nr:uncharacterized protein LOC110021378 isoform X2 [Phalaenopsis equestris]
MQLTRCPMERHGTLFPIGAAFSTPSGKRVDMHGSDNFMPLSPQWLQTKLGDNKMGTENLTSSHHGERTSSLKWLGNGEDSHEVGKRKDVYKRALHDSETGCQDRWRDEERETNSFIHRDQRGERWLGSSFRHSAERRNLSERWSESGNRESSFDQRRETKWTTRWGPVGKISQCGYGRDADKVGEASPRPWRSNSSMAREKAESSSQQSFTPHKQIHTGCGRGKGESSAPLSPSHHGSFNSSNANSMTSRPPQLRSFSAKSGLQTISSHLRYSRMKLLDIYKMIDIRSHRVFVDGIIDVPSLTRSEPLEPLALSAPTIEELLIMTAIEKGEVASSGVAQVFIEDTAGVNDIESVMLKQMKLGTHEGLHCIGGDYKHEGSGRHPNIEPVKQILEISSQKADSMTEEMSIPESPFSGSAAPWKSQSDGIPCLPSTGLNDYHAGFGVLSSGFNWSHLSVDAENEATSASVCSSFCKDDWLKNHSGDAENRSNPNIKRHASEISDREWTANPAMRNFEPLPSPEELSLYYKDPHGQVQGPFSGSDLIGWFEAGYFGIDLEVRLSSAPPDAPFWLLGDVIPQLRLKVRPPPGFCPAKQNVILEMSNRDNSTGSTVLNSHFGTIGFESSKSIQRSGILVSTIADNRFVESFSEGMQHEGGMHSPRYSTSLVGESGSDVNYLLAQKRLLEQRQNALPNSLPLVSGRDSSPMASTIGIISNSPSPAVSSGASPFSNFPDAQAPINNCPQNMMDAHQNQHFGPQFGFGEQQKLLLQPHNLPYLPHLANQSASIVSPEQLRSSDIAQDTQMLNMLARQYSQSQAPMQSQVSVPSQLSLFNECLVLKQQLQQQQQQLLLQQQHLLLSQLLAGHQCSPHFGEPPQKLDSSVSVGDVSIDNFLISQRQEAQTNENILADNLHDERDSTIQKVNLLYSNNTNNPSCSGPLLLQLPHQIFDIALPSKKHESIQDVGDHHASNLSVAFGQVATSLISDALEKPVEAFDSSDDALYLNCHAKEPKLSMPQPSEVIPSECSVLSQEASSTSGFGSPIVNQICAIKISSEDDFIEQHRTDFSAAKDSKNVETCQTKKSTERKARKKKNSKTQLALDLLRGFSNSNQLEQLKSTFDIEDLKSHDLSEAQTGKLKQPNDFVSTAVEDSSNNSFIPADYLKSHLPASVTDKGAETSNKKVGYIDGGTSEFSSLRAWKSAPGVKVKSLKEIQAEEQQRVQIENMASEIEPISTSCQLSVPWAGIVVGLDHNPGGAIVQVDRNAEHVLRSDSNLSSKSRLGHLHDLLAEEVLAKSSVGDDSIFIDNKEEFSSAVFDVNISRDLKGQLLSPVISATTSVDASAIHDEGFIETKDSKKVRKKGPKAKVSGAKSSSPVSSFDTSSSSLPVEREKDQNQTQKEKEGLPAPPTASLADFISWKGEQSNSSQAPAWSMDTFKLQKPTSLRDIQKEQENKLYSQQNIAMTTPTKVQSNLGNHGSGSLQVVGSYPSSGSSPIHGSSTLTLRQLKPKVEADLFWDLVDHPKQQEEQSDFPSLRNSNSSSAKTPAKTNPMTISRHKSYNSRPSLHSPSASLLSASRGDKKDDETINLSEATDFRDWCHKELARLTGANDTSFLEYCSKQSPTEAEMLLKANLGPFDPNHEFIDKFLSYKDFLSPEVIELAFRATDARLTPVHQVAGSGSTVDAETGKAGKKKGKKGKKVSAAVLGFNVSSNNRIMKGEIQTVDN